MTYETKNDKAWSKIFDKYNIVDEIKRNKFYKIKSSQINEFREARLMTKFDYKKNLPKLFIEYSLSILPITRGDYIISSFEAYHIFEKLNNIVEKVETPMNIESINFESITSESTTVNIAYITGMLEDFIGEKLLPTVNGRMSSEEFKFYINNGKSKTRQEILVKNSQIEIDGGYESENFLTLIEVKNSISEDFLIRQLYYPFRLWSNRVSKNIRNIFLIYSNSIFSFYEYGFDDLHDYNSLVLKKHKNYSLEDLKISLDNIFEIFDNIEKNIKEPEIPFPQADKFDRVINLCEILYKKNSLTREQITCEYDFDVRQTNYYTDAGRYLDLINREKVDGNITYYLTKKGKKILEKKYKHKNLLFVETILIHKVFYATFKSYTEKKRALEKHEIIEIMKKSDIYKVKSESTYSRRASTVSSWINWILNLGR